MNLDKFRDDMLAHLEKFRHTLSTDDGKWVVKGFIDVHRNIYTITIDTKVVSKIIELMLLPVISQFARDHGLVMKLSEHQNHYPDISFILPDETKIALDIKSTYRISADRVSGFTLGAFTGYFRERKSIKNITFPYEQYAGHFVLGIIYSRSDEAIDERRVYKLDELQDIVSVVGDFVFLLHEKWRIASDHPGSGNTKNIGSIKDIPALVKGIGPFSQHGRDVSDSYWMHYMTEDMARAKESVVPYHNLGEYWTWRNHLTSK